jgi:hypothetical protein
MDLSTALPFRHIGWKIQPAQVKSGDADATQIGLTNEKGSATMRSACQGHRQD